MQDKLKKQLKNVFYAIERMAEGEDFDIGARYPLGMGRENRIGYKIDGVVYVEIGFSKLLWYFKDGLPKRVEPRKVDEDDEIFFM